MFYINLISLFSPFNINLLIQDMHVMMQLLMFRMANQMNTIWSLPIMQQWKTNWLQKNSCLEVEEKSCTTQNYKGRKILRQNLDRPVIQNSFNQLHHA